MTRNVPTLPRIGLSLTCWLLAFAAARADIEIENEALLVRWDADGARLSVQHKASGREFLRDVRLSGHKGTAQLAPTDRGVSGARQVIEIEYADGGADDVILPARGPFVLFQTRVANRTDAVAIAKSKPTLSAQIILGVPGPRLKAFGTGGLLALDKNPGSYVWQAIVEPESRRGAVFGWLTHDRGSGVLFTSVDGDATRVDARLDFGRLALDAGAREELETLAVGYFDDARLGLEAWADAVAERYRIALPPQPVGYCTWYSRPHGGASDEKHLAELAEFAARDLAPYGFSVVQIDDKWQAGVSTNGPKRNFTQHNPDGPYPHGMQAAATHIASLGLTPGLWYMPFAGTHYDPFFKDHQTWFVKRENGDPYETAWGGTCLDLTHPEVRSYVQSVADRIVNEWGYRYLKLDGLWTGTATKQQYVNSGYKDDGIGDAVFHDPRMTNIQAYRSGLKLVREIVGRKTFILGCNGPQNMRSYGGAIGLVDAMRVGPDNGSDWQRLTRGPEFGSRHYFLHGRVWYNDPDPVYVRREMPLEHAQLICSWVAVSGQLNLSSEWLPGLPEDRLDVLKRTMPGHGLKPRPVDLFERDPPRLWLLTDERGEVRRDVLGVFNWDAEERTFDESLERIGLPEDVAYEAFDYWANLQLPAMAGRLQVAVPPRSCRILALRPRADRPQLLSTSRHVTQGIIDVRNERWDEASRALSGLSHVVGGEDYELRVVVPRSGTWRVAAAKASAGTVRFSQEGELVRVVLAADASGEVAWTITF
jgi:hypothetical protein